LSDRRLVLIEFNELSPVLLQELMGSGLLPNFSLFYRRSHVFTTDAGEDPPRLEPWIQWPTVHSGLGASAHGIFSLGDGRRFRQKMVGELLSDCGISVGLFAPMNANYSGRRLTGYVIPDPWDPSGEAHPPFLQPFYRTIAGQVQGSASGGSLSGGAALRLGWFAARHGLSGSTVTAAVRQLLADRRDPGVRWRRAIVLDRLQFDVFRNLNRRFRVRFASFFSNSTAHFQHYYWRNMRPGLFAVPPPDSDHPSFRGAVVAGYQAMDRLLGRFLREYGDDRLILCTALSQAPWTDTTKQTYRPRDFERFVRFLGVSPTSVTVQPVMAEEFHLACESAAAAEEVERLLCGLTANGERVMDTKRQGPDLLTGCRMTEPSDDDARVCNQASGETCRFGDLFLAVHSMRSGRHDRAGALWIRSGTHHVVEEAVPLTDIAPTVMAHFGIPQPARMPGRPLDLTSRDAAVP
jgi:hypothetical protein